MVVRSPNWRGKIEGSRKPTQEGWGPLESRHRRGGDPSEAGTGWISGSYGWCFRATGIGTGWDDPLSGSWLISFFRLYFPLPTLPWWYTGNERCVVCSFFPFKRLFLSTTRLYRFERFEPLFIIGGAFSKERPYSYRVGGAISEPPAVLISGHHLRRFAGLESANH